MQFYLTNAFFPWNQKDQVNLSQNSCISSQKHHHVRMPIHLLTSFKPLHGPFEPRLWTKPPPKKKHTSVKSPNNSPTSSEFGPDALGRCDPAHCNLYDTPFPLRRRPTRRCASDPRLQKKKQQRTKHEVLGSERMARKSDEPQLQPKPRKKVPNHNYVMISTIIRLL